MRLPNFILLMLVVAMLAACGTSRLPESAAEVSDSSLTGEAKRYFGLGQTAERKGDMQVAAMMYRAAADADHSQTAPVLALAHLQERAGNAAGASALYETAAAGKPEDTDLQLAAARTQLKAGRLEAAAAQYERVIAKRPDWRAYNGLGVVRSRQGDAMAASAAYWQALELAPAKEVAAVRRNLALSMLLNGDAPGAAALLEPLQEDNTAGPEDLRLLELARDGTTAKKP